MPTTSDKTIFVTGGTGFLGSYLLRYLVDKGYTNIRACRRSTSSMHLVQGVADQIQWLEGDMLDSFFLEDVMQDVHQVYHCAAMISFAPKAKKMMMEVNRQGTENVVNAALYTGIEKLVHVSSIAAIGRTKNNSTIDEKTKWQRSKHNTNYAISKYLAEQEVWRGIAEGLNANIINPSLIIGSGNWDDGPIQMFKLIWKNYPFYPIGTTGFVDVRDVARIMIELMEQDINAERFIVNAENLSLRNFMDLIANQLDRKKPHIAVSPLIQQIAWRIEWLRSKISPSYRPLITKETAEHSSRTYFYKNNKSTSLLNFEYTPIAQTVEESAKQFIESSKANFAAKCLPLN